MFKSVEFSIFKFLASIMVLLSTVTLLKIGDYSFFIIFQIIFCLCCVLFIKKIIIIKDKYLFLCYMGFIPSALIGYIWNHPQSYKKAAIFMTLLLVLTVLSATYCCYISKTKIEILRHLVNVFGVSVLIQSVWIIIQFLIYSITKTDINNIVFVKLFHTTDDASFVRDWVWHPAGLCNHPAVVAPAFVIGICLYKNKLIRILIISAAILCGSSTSIIGCLIALFIEKMYYLRDYKYKKELKSNNLILAIIIVPLITYLYLKTDLFMGVFEHFQYLIERIILGVNSDSSTKAHIQYYYDYLYIMKKSNFFQVLFGCGEGCSGMWSSLMYNRYVGLGNWSIECDIVNILVSRGIIGFVTYYCFLLSIVVRGRKISIYYPIAIVAITIQGFFYNVQWNYIFLIEIIMSYMISINEDFFEIRGN